jgi:hypothetical protein
MFLQHISHTAPKRLKFRYGKKFEKLGIVEIKLLSTAWTKFPKHILKWVRINIYEAGITEKKWGMKANAVCAQELNDDIANNPPIGRFHNSPVVPEGVSNNFYSSLMEKDNAFPAYDFSQQWVSMYITWNMAFALGNVDELDIVLGSVRIPVD